jgi:hypothetical protein
MSTPDSKKCTKCGEVKPLDDYYKDRRSKDGRYSKCKICHNSVCLDRYSKLTDWQRDRIRMLVKRNFEANKPAVRIRKREQEKKRRELRGDHVKALHQASYIKGKIDVSDSYIANLIGIRVDILRRLPEYIEAKRQQILLKRQISNQQKQQDE